jgi:prepilin-type N-terminal cleavage/methylation domain-containing protein
MFHIYKKNAGFSLAELLVSLGILTVILAIILSSQSNYTNRAALTNLADEIGLSIAQAQVYGVGTKEFSVGSGEFSASYGLTFSLLGGSAGSPTAYFYFADRDPDLTGPLLPDKVYGGNWNCVPGGANECLEKVTISGGNSIQSLCVVFTSGGDDCTTPRRIDISFDRPNTEAQLIFFNSVPATYVPANMKGARITLISASGLIKSVLVYKSGQISIQ